MTRGRRHRTLRVLLRCVRHTAARRGAAVAPQRSPHTRERRHCLRLIRPVAHAVSTQQHSCVPMASLSMRTKQHCPQLLSMKQKFVSPHHRGRIFPTSPHQRWREMLAIVWRRAIVADIASDFPRRLRRDLTNFDEAILQFSRCLAIFGVSVSRRGLPLQERGR